MSDRRPEKLYKSQSGVTPGPAYQRYTHVEASPADLVAAVRRGVESGTIEGRELDWLDPDNEGQFRRVLVIPVSDGGSET